MDKQVIKLDSTQIVQFMKCPDYHNFVSVQNLYRKGVTRAALDRGTVLHGLIQRYYQKIWENEPWSSAMNYAMSKLNELKETVTLEKEDYALLTLRFSDYCVKYYNDKLKIATINGKPAIEVGFSVPIFDSPTEYFVLEGKIDMITIMSDQHVIWDHKSQGRKYFLYGHSVQALNYSIASKTPSFMYNYVRLHQKVQPDTYDRKLTTIKKSIADRWMVRLLNVFRGMGAFRNGMAFPNQACSDIGFGKMCPFTPICESFDDRRVQKLLLERDYAQRTPWEPWSLDEIEGADNGE